MKSKVFFLLLGIGAILLTSLLYLIDSDPPYEQFKDTAIEFSLITAMFYGLFISLYFGLRLIRRTFRRSKSNNKH